MTDVKHVKTKENFIRVSVELLNLLDYNIPFEMQLAMTLLYKGRALQLAWDDIYIETTPSLLVKYFNRKELPRRQENNVVKALTDMRDRGLILFDGDIKFKDEISINVEPLLKLAYDNPIFVKLPITVLYEIMESDNIIKVNNEEVEAKHGYESLLLQTYLTVRARWNTKTINELENVDDFAYAIISDKTVQDGKGAFCSDTLDYIRTHKHYSLDKIENWCDDRYLKAYLDKLKELGCIKIYSRKMKAQNGTWATRNFYYDPSMSFDCIEAMVGQYARRQNYAIKHKDDVADDVVVEDNIITEKLPKRYRRRIEW